jgi:hypothetical protein
MVVNRVVWDGTNAHVYIFCLPEELDFTSVVRGGDSAFSLDSLQLTLLVDMVSEIRLNIRPSNETPTGRIPYPPLACSIR